MIPFLKSEAASAAPQTPSHEGTPTVSDDVLTFSDLLDGLIADDEEKGVEDAEVDIVLDSAETDLDQEEDEQAGVIWALVGPSLRPETGRSEEIHADIESPIFRARIERDIISQDATSKEIAPTDALAKRALSIFEGRLAPTSTEAKPENQEFQNLSQSVEKVQTAARGLPQAVDKSQTDVGDLTNSVEKSQKMVQDVPKITPIAAPVAGKPVAGVQNRADLRLSSENSPVPYRTSSRSLVQSTTAPPATMKVQPANSPIEVSAVPLDIEPQFVAQLERAGHAPPSLTQAPLTQVDTARHVASQIAVAVIDRAGRPTEISLSPGELGRVRLTMSTVDTAITLTISAERQETTDLLRKHIETLTQEFKDLGYNDISFTFGQGESAPDADPDQLSEAPDQPIDTEETPIQRATQIVGTSGLDIKL
jgi:flagellar hook-length control protein FliK